MYLYNFLITSFGIHKKYEISSIHLYILLIFHTVKWWYSKQHCALVFGTMSTSFDNVCYMYITTDWERFHVNSVNDMPIWNDSGGSV